jgi:hypothetical protein
LAVGAGLLSNDQMPLQGDLATLPARDLLEMLVRTRASGRLSVSRGMAARRFHVRDGHVMLASSSEERTLLGRLLVERGLIDEAQLQGAIAARKGARTPLGKTLADTGLVSAAQLASVLAEKVERLLVDTMSWRDGQFYFDEEAPPRRGVGVVSAVDLAGLLARPGSRFPRNNDPEVFAVSDADVIEMQALGEPAAKAKATTTTADPRPRRRKRRAAAA